MNQFNWYQGQFNLLRCDLNNKRFSGEFYLSTDVIFSVFELLNPFQDFPTLVCLFSSVLMILFFSFSSAETNLIAVLSSEHHLLCDFKWIMFYSSVEILW